jgi:uncharacterized protein YjiS (DUF1127 family)
MNAQVAKEEIALLMPNTLSHYFKEEVEYMPQPEAKGPGLLGRLAAVLRWIAELPQRRAVVDELSALTDHELADIGLTRSEVAQVFDPTFAAQRNGERIAIRGGRGFSA